MYDIRDGNIPSKDSPKVGIHQINPFPRNQSVGAKRMVILGIIILGTLGAIMLAFKEQSKHRIITNSERNK